MSLGEFQPYELSDESIALRKQQELSVQPFIPKGMKLIEIQFKDDDPKPISFTYCHEEDNERYTSGYLKLTPYGIKLNILEEMKRNNILNIQDRMKYSFDTYKTNNKWQQTVKSIALDYVENFNYENWFVITGISGSGKTHISTSVIFGLASKGIKVDYVSWVKFKNDLKNDLSEAGSRIHFLKKKPILYIDDFLKTGKDGENPSNYDLEVATEIIWGRYDLGLPTIISCEYDVQNTINRWNRGLAYRLVEGSNKYLIEIGNDDKRNFRKHGEL